MYKLLRWKIAQTAERIWWKRYLRNKDTTNYLLWKKNYWHNLIELCKKTLVVKDTDIIIDAGCGPAGIFINFPMQKVYAFDPLLHRYEKDLQHFKKEMYTNVHFDNATIEEYSNTEAADVLFCMNAINHVQDIEKAYNNLVKLVKPNGYICITIDAHNYNVYKKIFQLLPGDILHPHQYDLAEYKIFLTQRNCTIQDTIQLEKHYFFNHYMLIAKKNSTL